MYPQKSISFFITLIFLSIFTYGQANLSSGLTAYYPLDGNANDFSGHSFNGITYGVSPTQNRFGIDNHAYSFNGTNSFIGLGNNFGYIFSNSNRQFAFSLWLKINYINDTYQIFSKSATQTCGESQRELAFTVVNGHLTIVVHYSLNNNNTRVTKTIQSLSQDTWYHIVMNFDGNQVGNNGLDQISFYVNNTKYNTTLKNQTGSISPIIGGTAHLGLGNNLSSSGMNCGTYNLYGAMDDVFIYDRILSTTEIDILYNKTSDINIPKARSSFTVYPTLVNKTLFIKSNVSGNFQLKIIDIDGKLISENSFTNSTNPIKQDVSNLKDGVYFVQIITNNNCSTKKFVKF